MFRISTSLVFLSLLTFIACEGLKDPSAPEETNASSDTGTTTGGSTGGGTGGVPLTGKIIALTVNSYAGDFPGSITSSPSDAILEADRICESEFGPTYKALLGSSVRTPVLDWPLQPDTRYIREDRMAVIGTTNSSAIFSFPLEHSFSTLSGEYWSGIRANGAISNYNCTDWTDPSDIGSFGVQSTSSTAMHSSYDPCNSLKKLLCVEQ